ncbi:hypothetical protein JCM11251_005512 [Rhodosporidiobolus azoricus]
MLASSTGHPLVTLRADARSRAPTQLPPIREAHIALRLAEEAPDDEYSDLQQYLEWPTTSVGEELDRRTSLIKLVEGQEKKRFKAFVKQAKVKHALSIFLDQVPISQILQTCAADLESRRRLVEKEALKTSDIPPLRKNADFNLAELQRVEEEKGHASLDFLAALHGQCALRHLFVLY